MAGHTVFPLRHANSTLNVSLYQRFLIYTVFHQGGKEPTRRATGSPSGCLAATGSLGPGGPSKKYHARVSVRTTKRSPRFSGPGRPRGAPLREARAPPLSTARPGRVDTPFWAQGALAGCPRASGGQNPGLRSLRCPVPFPRCPLPPAGPGGPRLFPCLPRWMSADPRGCCGDQMGTDVEACPAQDRRPQRSHSWGGGLSTPRTSEPVDVSPYTAKGALRV